MAVIPAKNGAPVLNGVVATPGYVDINDIKGSLRVFAGDTAANTGLGSLKAAGQQYFDSVTNTVRTWNGSAWLATGGGVTASTDNAIARFDGTTGALQNSAVLVSDAASTEVGVSAATGNRLLLGSSVLVKLNVYSAAFSSATFAINEAGFRFSGTTLRWGFKNSAGVFTEGTV